MEPIAVVGISFRLAQEAVDESAFWEVLVSRKSLMSEWPSDRLAIDAYHDQGTPQQNKLPARGAHFVSQDVSTFDAPFFSITPSEAAAMDPQQRWALETSYRAFENAGMPMEALRGSKTAVFGAASANDYEHQTCKDLATLPRKNMIGISKTILTNRLSWYFDLLGPSVFIDTACSGSLVALDLACQSIRAGDATAALVVGANVLTNAVTSMGLANLGFLSPDSRSYSFDHRANGFSRGEGIVALVIKPLSSAIQNGDMIRGLIRATGSNQDGHTATMTQPSAMSQEALIRRVYEKAALDLSDTRYVEAHGTGTSVGDPLEIRALSRAFGECRSATDPLYVGSVKANIGHLEGGSGLASFVKTLMVLEKGKIPPQALLEKVNPAISNSFDNISIPFEEVPWPSDGVRRASINSFGFGGTNSHVILEDGCSYLHDRDLNANHTCLRSSAPALTKEYDSQTSAKLLVWSAADQEAVGRMLEAYNTYFKRGIQGKNHMIDRLAYTLASRRTYLGWRTFAIVNNTSSAIDAAGPVRSRSKGGLAYVFAGQGAQYVNMGLELLRYPTFERSLLRIDEIYAGLGCGWSLFDELLREDHIHLPEYSQPLTTAIQVALVELLRSFGVSPIAVTGHSSGEIAAAFATGALSLDSACKIAYFRGKAVDRIRRETTKAGAMMAVNLTPDEIPEYVARVLSSKDRADEVSVACINSPSNCTLSGPEESIDMLKDQLDQDGIFARKLKTGVAYHSEAMQPAVPEQLESLTHLTAGDACISSLEIPMISSVTGKLVERDLLREAHYWTDNMVSPVRFSEAVANLMTASEKSPSRFLPITDIIEISPRTTLKRPVLDTLNTVSGLGPNSQPRYHSLLDGNSSSVHSVLETAARLFCHGHEISIAAVNCHGEKAPPFLVDCPPYPFNTSLRYWAESRISRDTRTRARPSVQPLGMRSPDWIPQLPRWRNILSTESSPWLKHHVVDGMLVMPGMGSVVTAVQAVMEHLGPDIGLSGFLIKQGNFERPVIVNENAESTELVTQLRPLHKSQSEGSLFEVQVLTYRDDTWTQCFSAVVQAIKDEVSPDEIDKNLEHRLEHDRIFERLKGLDERCKIKIDEQQLYQHAPGVGIVYGDTFQLLSRLKWNGSDTCVGSIDRPGPDHPGHMNMLHPTVLDAAIHTILVQMSEGFSAPSATALPYKLSNTWISAKGWQTSSLRVVTETRYPGGKPSDPRSCVSCYITNAEGESICSMEDLILRPVTKAVPEQQEEPMPLHSVDWKPQIRQLSRDQLQSWCHLQFPSPIQDVPGRNEYYKTLRAFMIKSLQNLLRDISSDDLKSSPAHIHKYLSVAKSVALPELELEHVSLDYLLAKCDSEQPQGWNLVKAVFEQLKPMILGQIDPLEVFFGQADVGSFYEASLDSFMGKPTQTFLEVVCHERPLRLLEVGAGTGSLTKHILSVLGALEKRDGSMRVLEYTYTDISPGFFEKAKDIFREYSDRMIFSVLDLESDALSQGFSQGDYDMVLAANVLHATSNLTATLKNVRQLLAPDGHIVLFEILPHYDWTNLLWGILPGWWLSEEEWRANCPLASEDQWDEVLRTAGFSGNELVIRGDDDGYADTSALFVSRATSEDRGDGTPITSIPALPKRLLLVTTPDCTQQLDLAEAVIQNQDGSAVTLSEASRLVQAGSEVVVIFLLEMLSPFLSTISQSDFESLKNVVEKVDNLLWVTFTTNESRDFPASHIATGFFRTIQSESPHKRACTLVIEDGTRPEPARDHIFKVLQASGTSKERQFLIRDGIMYTGRAREDRQTQTQLESLTTTTLRQEPLAHGKASILDFGVSGLIDTWRFAEDVAFHGEPLGENEVEMKTRGWAINFRDVLISLGQLEDRKIGFECVGEVTRVGSDCQHLRPGDRAMMISSGCFRTHARGNALLAMKIPDSWSYEEAVSAITPATTAYGSLINIAKLRKGEKILIHSAAGSTGQMAVQLAKRIGAEIFATVGYASKKRLLMEEFGIPEDHIFYSRNTSFAQGVMRMTQGRGVDVALNSLAGEALRATWECMAPWGRFLELGKADIQADSSLPMGRFRGNVAFFAVDIEHMTLTVPSMAKEILNEAMHLLETKELQFPIPRHVFPVSELGKALKLVQGGKQSGRVVVTADDMNLVPKLSRNIPAWRFDPNASYVIAGGLGGIGRSVSNWMVGKGAKNLILLSRSGVTSEVATSHVAGLRRSGATVFAPRCDIASSESVRAVFDECRLTMPPIRGCINGANSMSDTLFEDMTYQQWEVAVKTKVSGSWNLDSLLPDDLDFFILLSSLSGIVGNSGQSNYAAGCTYQDALAYHRVCRGQKAVCFDIGRVSSIGFVAENESVRRAFETRKEFVPIEEEILLGLFDIYCDPSLPVLDPSQAQILIGFRPKWLPTPLPMFEGFMHADKGGGEADTHEKGVDNASSRFEQAKSPAEQWQVVTQAIQIKLAALLQVSPENIDVNKPFSKFSVDSLIGVELRNWVRHDFKADVTVFDIMGEKTASTLAKTIITRTIIKV